MRSKYYINVVAVLLTAPKFCCLTEKEKPFLSVTYFIISHETYYRTYPGDIDALL